LLEERLALLRQHVPGLWDGQGRSLLYVGAAPGRFECGRELARAGYELTVLEAWAEYARAYEEHPLVARVIEGDVREISLAEHYDVAFWWHGPEHVERGEVLPTLRKLEQVADLVVIGCPWGRYEQGAVDGNPYQAHRCALYPAEFRRWGYRVVVSGQRDRRGSSIIAWKQRGVELPEVIAVIAAFQEEAMLAGCLESLQGQVSRIVVVDGAYAHFPCEVPVSTDATREIALAYGAEWILPPEDAQGEPVAWADQMAKRSAYLIGDEGDWYFHIDADERLVGCLPVPEDGQHYALQIFTRELHNTWVPRLWQHRGWMRYEGSHNALWSDDRLIHMKGSVRVDPSDCRFLHLAHLRHEDRQRDKGKYYAWKRPAEMGYRRAHQI